MHPEKLGPYTIGRMLGRGGMGAVYEGTCEVDNSTVAIKVLTDSFAEDAEVRIRFESEIETLKRLHHPNIVRLSGFGEENGQLYYVMEIVDGSSLQQELRKKRRFQWHEAAKIGFEICQALRHAHDRGIVHRDIKPANILLSQEGNVKLSDFGIARFFGAQQITDAHSIVGTLEYMSPEQALANPIGANTDLYSLGCVLYALLTGKPPFSARSLPELLRKHRSSSPAPISPIRQDVPDELEGIIMDLLQIRPDDRPRHALPIAKRLQALLHTLFGSFERFDEKYTTDKSPTVLVSSETSPPDSPFDMPDDPERVSLLANTVTSLSAQIHGEDSPQTSVPNVTENNPVNQYEIPAELSKSATRFTAVTSKDFDPYEEDTKTRPILSLPTVLTSTTLMIVGFIVYYLLQPVPPDTLYKRIAATIKAGDGEDGYSLTQLRSAQNDIQQFLAMYPGHPSAKQVMVYQEELDLSEHERRLERRMQYSALRSLSPVERAYVSALTSSPNDSEETIERLHAFIAVFQTASSLSEMPSPTSSPVEICVELARRRLKKLESEVEEINAEQVQVLRRRLDIADELDATDSERASDIRRGVIMLYQHHRWAKELVGEAKERLGGQD